ICRCDAGVEHDLAAQVEAIGDVVGVSENFRLRRIFFRPVPFLVQLFRERERVLQALDVAAGSGIAIPVPRSADAAAGLVDPCGESELPQSMQHVQAGKTRADHDGIEGPRFGQARCSRLSHGCHVPLSWSRLPRRTTKIRATAASSASATVAVSRMAPMPRDGLTPYQTAVPFMVGCPCAFAVQMSMPPEPLSLALIENSLPSNNGCSPR